MNNKHIAFALLAASLLTSTGYGLYQFGMTRGLNRAVVQRGAEAVPSQTQAGQEAAAGKKILYWHDPMVPGQQFDQPGKSPFMDMQLVPVYAGPDSDDGKVSISARIQQNLGIRTALVVRGKLLAPVEVVGSVAYNERDVALLQARSNGFIERLYVRAPLDPVRKGQPLADLYVPEWLAAQEEYLSIQRMAGAGGSDLLEAARQRMRLVGMTEDQIRLVAATGTAHTRLTITAPISGVVTELGARQGMTMLSGAPLFRINGLSSVWVNAEVPENQAALIRPGTTVQARTPALPGIVLNGKVSAILPEVNTTTRTLKARIELANPSGQLVPGMFATIRLNPAARKEALLVPSEALIQTGSRTVVMLAQAGGTFLPVNVEIGAEANGQSEITQGLEAGQKIVVSGQFLIDSEASLQATTTRMSESPASAPGPALAPPVHRGEGSVEKISKDEITLSHGPIASLQWGPMTMGFKLPASGLPGHIAVGDKVAFEIRQTKDQQYQITTITALSALPGSQKMGPAEGAK